MLLQIEIYLMEQPLIVPGECKGCYTLSSQHDRVPTNTSRFIWGLSCLMEGIGFDSVGNTY